MKPSFPQKLPLLVWASTRLTTCRGSSDEAPWLGSKRPPGRVWPPCELQGGVVTWQPTLSPQLGTCFLSICSVWPLLGIQA